MNINTISQNTNNNQTNFGMTFVALTRKNLGEKIARDVVDVFNAKIFPEIQKLPMALTQDVFGKTGTIASAKDLQEKVNCFIVAGGAGSRFRELAQTVGNYNKISLPFKVSEKQDLHMLDFSLALCKYFTDKNGAKSIVAENPAGSFSDVVRHYLAGNPIKDTVVCCGDNVFGTKSEELTSFIINSINNPQCHIGLVGMKRPPEVVANRFGVMNVAGKNTIGDTYQLKGFSEKPSLEEAQKLAINGENIANTGLFYMSKEAMSKIVEELSNGINNIKRNDKEVFDFAQAIKYAHSKLSQWFNIQPEIGGSVKVVEQCEDLGEPNALYRFMEKVKDGHFMQDFPEEFSKQTQEAFKNRVHLQAQTPYILFTKSARVTREMVQNAEEVKGVKIIV